MRHPGDPTPRSARELLADLGNYKVMVTERSPQLGGQAMNTLVVVHSVTETYWATEYVPSQETCSMTWQQVSPVVQMRTTYRPVS